MEDADSGSSAGGRVCPDCREPMEHGFLAGASHPIFGGLRWFNEARFHFTYFGGEELVPSAWLNANTYVEGFRCRRCNLLVLHY